MRFALSLIFSMACATAFAGSNDSLTCIPAKPSIQEALDIAKTNSQVEVFALATADAKAYLDVINNEDPKTDYSGDGIFGLARNDTGIAIFGILRDSDTSICMGVRVGIGMHNRAMQAVRNRA